MLFFWISTLGGDFKTGTDSEITICQTRQAGPSNVVSPTIPSNCNILVFYGVQTKTVWIIMIQHKTFMYIQCPAQPTQFQPKSNLLLKNHWIFASKLLEAVTRFMWTKSRLIQIIHDYQRSRFLENYFVNGLLLSPK